MRASPWHGLEPAQVFQRLGAGPEGLTSEQAEQRRLRFGANSLPEPKTQSKWRRFLLQFDNLLIYVLLAAAAITLSLQHWLDAGVIFGVVLVNAVIGYLQEGKAEEALDAIRKMLSPAAMVLRDGRRIRIAANALVPGDIVFLQSGDKVPADIRLLHTKGLQIQEAALTGESVAVEKSSDAVEAGAVLGDRISMAYSGTFVTNGRGTGVVVETGPRTELGRISTLVGSIEPLTTPLLRQVAQFSRWITLGILGLALALFMFGVWVREYSAGEMFLAAVGLAVAAIPEGLPAIMTITLAIGVQRMARRRAIIRRLPAVETLGSVSVICTDKTGTLTRNEMTVSTVVTGTAHFDVEGSGYSVHGRILVDGEPSVDASLLELVRAGVLCNDASLEPRTGAWRVHGDPMEAALLVLAHKAGIDPDREYAAYPRVDHIPFESHLKLMATLHHASSGRAFVVIKGAPDYVVPKCSTQRQNQQQVPIDHTFWNRAMQQLAGEGRRVLALASKPVGDGQRRLEHAMIQDGLVLLGLVGVIDPPRDEAVVAVRRCRQAGIRVKMITGDHALTAKAIAAQLQMTGTERVLTGQDLDRLDETALACQVREVDIYARVSPVHKLMLVEALQRQGAIVAMTGDGVNDAPALRRADVGIAMGQKGTEAAKEASEIVLADDNFASISHAIEEGRTVYDNFRKAILFILPTNGGEALAILVAILLGFQQLPLTPAQILWVNMITAVTLALALAFEPPEPEIMRRAPRDPQRPILTPLFLWRILLVSVVLLAGTFGLFLRELNNGAGIDYARTVAVNTLVMFEVFYLFNSRYIDAPVLNRQGLLGNKYVLAAIGTLLVFQLLFTYFPPLQALFATKALDLSTWLVIIVTSSSVLFLIEGEKALLRRSRGGKT